MYRAPRPGLEVTAGVGVTELPSPLPCPGGQPGGTCDPSGISGRPPGIPGHPQHPQPAGSASRREPLGAGARPAPLLGCVPMSGTMAPVLLWSSAPFPGADRELPLVPLTAASPRSRGSGQRWVGMRAQSPPCTLDVQPGRSFMAFPPEQQQEEEESWGCAASPHPRDVLLSAPRSCPPSAFRGSLSWSWGRALPPSRCRAAPPELGLSIPALRSRLQVGPGAVRSPPGQVAFLRTH